MTAALLELVANPMSLPPLVLDAHVDATCKRDWPVRPAGLPEFDTHVGKTLAEATR
jgi:hypothetical protein